MHSRARRLHTSRATRVAVAPARGRGDDDRAHLLQARHRERGRHRQSVRGLRMIRFGGVDDTDTIDHTPSRRIRRPPEQPPGDRGVRRPDARQRSLRAPDTPLVTGERYPQPTIHFSTPAGRRLRRQPIASGPRHPPRVAITFSSPLKVCGRRRWFPACVTCRSRSASPCVPARSPRRLRTAGSLIRCRSRRLPHFLG